MKLACLVFAYLPMIISFNYQMNEKNDF